MKLKEDQIENKEITNKRTAKIELAKDRELEEMDQKKRSLGKQEKYKSSLRRREQKINS